MGHSQAEKAASHARIVAIAARLFRERGLAAVGLAEIMAQAGLSVGAFYRHFDSREALVAEVLSTVFAGHDAWEHAAQAQEDMLRDYLSARHRDAPASGCAMASLLGDIGKSGEAARALYTQRVSRSLEYAQAAIAACGADAPARAQAILQVSACLGALGLARAVSDPALSQEILEQVGQQLIAMLPRAA